MGEYNSMRQGLALTSVVLFSLLLGFSSIYGSDLEGETLQSREKSLHAESMLESLRLTVVVEDSGTGDTLHARCNVVDGYSVTHYPVPGTSFAYYSLGGYFYTNGVFSVDLPCGFSVIRLGHGPEYEPLEAGVNLGVNDTTIVLELNRIADMRANGWISGDTHIHINHDGGQYGLIPSNVFLMGKAEDLQIVNCLDNGYFFTGAADACSDDECIIYMTAEFRSDIYGHMALLGLSSPVLPYWCRWWPMTTDIADSVAVQQGAITVSAHPISSEDFMNWGDWPETGIGRALPVDIIGGNIHGFEVMSYSNCHAGRETDLWYRILNCGFHLPACGATDACMNRWDTWPLGGNRTYVYMPGEDFDTHAWLAGIAAGRTFATNGPLITGFEVDGAMPGETLYFSSPGKSLSGSVAVTSAFPLDRVEIIKNGEVATSFAIGGSESSIDTTFSIWTDESCWLAARVYGANDEWYPVGDSLFAHTSPLYIHRFGMPVLVKEDAIYLYDWIGDLMSIIETDGEFSDPLDSLTVLDRLETAREYYLDLAFPLSPAYRDAGDTPGLPILMQNVPNPFNASTFIRLKIPESSAGGRVSVELAVFDVAGRLIKTVFSGELPPGIYDYYWDGKSEEGRAASSGVYFARLITPGSARTVKMILLR
jgi:hypothetical protein